MAESTDKTPFVAHSGDLDILKEHWAAARGGDARAVVLSGPLGAGKRALVGELCRAALAEDEDVLLWRASLHDEEDGLQTLLRVFAAQFAALHRSPQLRGRVEMALNSQLPKEPKRVQGWYQAFIEGLKKGAPKPGEQQFQVTLPRDNPLIGMVEIACGISRRFPMILDIQGLHNCHSLGFFAMLEALIHESSDCRLLVILGNEPVDDVNRNWMSLPLIDMLDRNADRLHTLSMTPWGADETRQFLESKDISGDAGRIAEICQGRPGFIAELVDWLDENDKLGSDISKLTWADLADLTPDPDELEEPEAEEGSQRKPATADDAERIAYLAALLGLSFPSGLVADMGGYVRDSVDDLLDATEDIYKELQFSQPLGTWVYQFQKALLRESVLARHTSDEDRQIAQRVGAFMERFLVPRGFAYLVKTMRLYAENDAPQRAAILRSVALANDPPQMWGMSMDLVKYFDEISWPDPMRRTVYMNLLDRMIASGDVQQTEGLFNEAMAWANEHEDRSMQAWLLFAGSRLDYRRQDLYRARDRANDALTLYNGLGDQLKVAEINNHIGLIELADGNPNAALERAAAAEAAASVPPVQAHAEYIRGMVEKRNRKAQAAAEHFRKANEIAGNAGQAALALEAGLHYGEALLVSGQHSQAADVLARVVQIAGALRDGVKQRAATALLAQSHAALKNYEAALQHATATLELTRQLKFTRLESVDLYNMGFFNMMLGRHTEAVTLLKQARAGADATDAGFQKELLFNLGRALTQIGESAQAEDILTKAMEPARAAKDWGKVMASSEMLADIATARGDAAGARKLLDGALQAADAGGLKEARKGLRRKLEALG